VGYRFDDDNEFEEADEEETDESDDDEASADDDDESEDDDDDDDDDEAAGAQAEDEAQLTRIEKAYRAERAVVRACDDVADLRTKRREYLAILGGTTNSVGRLRVNDLIELVDERVIELKAGRFAAGRP
jgi:hypothetical protein